MKTIRLIFLALALGLGSVAYQGCGTPPSERVVVVQSLLAVGQSAEAVVSLSAQLYRDGKISAAQARAVLDLYDKKFQPTYRIAATAAHNDLNALASPEVWGLFQQLSALVNSFSKPPSP